MKKLTGMAAGVFWAMDTVIMGIALSRPIFLDVPRAVFLAPFVSAFLHDFCSCCWMLLYTGLRKQFGNVCRAIKTKSGKFIVLGALFGGPVGMTGYVFAIRYLGASYTAMVSALYPALGAFLSWIFLKERMEKTEFIGFLVSLVGMILLGASTAGENPENFLLGFCFALLCVCGWAIEVVICAYGMKDPKVDNEQALMIRQATSAFFHGMVILNLVKGTDFAYSVAGTDAFAVILCAAFGGTISYLCYYKTIRNFGPSRAMALNITYGAWALVFEFFLLGVIPSPMKILCGTLILSGAFLTALATKGRKER